MDTAAKAHPAERFLPDKRAMPFLNTSLRRLEWIVAGLITIAAVGLHFVYLTHAGGLWRDEVSVINISLSPTLGQVWEALPHDHCPIVFPALVRLWSAAGLGAADIGLRLLGLGCGLLLLASFWLAARMMDKGLPLLSLALAGLNFTVIRYGDSLRAYGLATACILVTMALIWRFLEEPGWPRGLLAALVATISVQTLYQNAFFLLTICVAGAVVCIRRHQQRRAVGVLSLGLPAALSLLPYISPLRHAQSWWIVSQTGVDFTGFLFRMAEAAGMLMGVWLVLAVIASIFGIGCALIKTSPGEAQGRQDLLLFAGTALILGLAGFGFFVRLSGLPTQRWYYIPAMGFAVVCCDLILPRIHRGARIGVLIIAVVVAGLAFPSAASALKLRQTNGDLLAAQVSKNARPDDLIIVHPWYFGITFGYYYRGSAAWTTLPPLEDYRYHRYDLLKTKLQMTNVIEPVLKRVETTLRSGHAVWIVGNVPMPHPNQAPPVDLPPAPRGPEGWGDQPYTFVWGARFSYRLVYQITNVVTLVGPMTNQVSPMEDMTLAIATGWRSTVQTNSP